MLCVGVPISWFLSVIRKKPNVICAHENRAINSNLARPEIEELIDELLIRMN